MFLIWKILYNREIHLSGYGGCILYLYRLDIRQVLMQRLLYTRGESINFVNWTV